MPAEHLQGPETASTLTQIVITAQVVGDIKLTPIHNLDKVQGQIRLCLSFKTVYIEYYYDPRQQPHFVVSVSNYRCRRFTQIINSNKVKYYQVPETAITLTQIVVTASDRSLKVNCINRSDMNPEIL